MKKRRKKDNLFQLIHIIVVLCAAGILAVIVLGDKENNKSALPGDIAEEQSADIVIRDTETEKIEGKTAAFYIDEVNHFELPVQGATGYAAVDISLFREKEVPDSEKGNVLAGEGFTILREEEDWWYIRFGEQEGWVKHEYCMINLPDILPSIIYFNDNATASMLRSSGEKIPNITGEVLYESFTYTGRYEMEQYIMPVLYSMAPKIAKAQLLAREDGNTLIIYETYRPYEVQRKIVDNFSALVQSNQKVSDGVNQAPWSIGWFIATRLSNHQRGVAMDVSLGKVIEEEMVICGDYKYYGVLEYDEYIMPTPMHELSAAAVTFRSGVSSASKTEWKNCELSDTMNEPAILLQNYCTNAELTPLASEWWHFNDLDSKERIADTQIGGQYYISENYSVEPVSAEEGEKAEE